MKGRDPDIGIIERNIYDSQLLTIPFAEDDTVIVVPVDFPKEHGDEISLKELSNQTWIIRESGSGTRQVTDTMFTRTGLGPTSVLEFGSTRVIKETVKNGLGISYMSKVSVKEEIEKGLMKALTIEEYRDSRTFYYVTHKSQPNTIVLESFISLIKNVC